MPAKIFIQQTVVSSRLVKQVCLSENQIRKLSLVKIKTKKTLNFKWYAYKNVNLCIKFCRTVLGALMHLLDYCKKPQNYFIKINFTVA